MLPLAVIYRWAFATAILSLQLVSAGSLQAAGINEWLTGSSNWTDSTHWSQTAVPGTAGHLDDDVQFFASRNGNIALDQSMFPGGLTVRTILGQLSNSGSSGIYLNAAGNSVSPLVMNLGDAVTPPNRVAYIGNYQKWNLDWVNLNIDATVTAAAASQGNGMGLMLEGNDKILTQANLVAFDSNITVSNAPSPNMPNSYNLGLFLGGNDRSAAEMIMTRGSLSITNGGGNAGIVIGAQGSGELNSGRGNALLHLTDTVFTANQMRLRDSGTFFFNGAGAASPSSVSGQIDLNSNALVDLVSGEISIGSLTWTSNVGQSRLLVRGADVTVGSAIMNRANAILDVSSGSLEIGTLDVYGGLSNGVKLSGTGTLNVTTKLTFGRLGNPTGPDGLLDMSGGTLIAEEVQLGNQNGNGYWRQTGGNATVNGTFLLGLTGPDGRNEGAREVTVGENSTLTLTGEGFQFLEYGGNGGKQVVLDEWNTPGTLKFSPGVGVTSQTLYAFSEQDSVSPPDFGDGETILQYMLDHDGIGTLDLIDLDGIDQLSVLPSGNFGTNALYVNALLGLTPGTVNTHLDSPINIYYNAAASPGLQGLTYALDSGGFLIGITPIPEPNSLLLLSMGCIGLIRRHRRNPNS